MPKSNQPIGMQNLVCTNKRKEKERSQRRGIRETKFDMINAL